MIVSSPLPQENTSAPGPPVNLSSPFPPIPTPAEAIDKLISTIQNLDDNVPQSVKTSLTAALKQILDILSDNNSNNDESAACGRLGAFINKVDDAAERNDRLTADQAADYLKNTS